MSFLIAFFYDRCMATTEEACLREWRRELLEQVSGEVLEIGAGTGANIELYPETALRLTASEPDKHMREQLKARISGLQTRDITVCSGSAENIEADDASFDFVVTSLVCCSVTDLDAALMEIRRVLKPGGGLIFLEHVAAEAGTRRRLWQNRITPLWRKLAGNCHLNRETEAAIVSAGFTITDIKRESMQTPVALVRPTIRGIAVKAPVDQTELSAGK
jgi:ubiquinone/menaquinone biosynthesis C-methylase UbiE